MKLSNLSSAGFDSATRVRAWLQQGPGSVLLAMRRLLPQTCTLCGIASGDSLLCISCGVALPSVVCACPVCALPAPTWSACGDCLARPPPFCAAIAPWVYAFPIDRLVHAFKYGGRLALAEPFASALGRRHRATRAPAARCPRRAAAFACASARSGLQPGGRDRPARGAGDRPTARPGAGAHPRFTTAGGAGVGRSGAQRPRRVPGEPLACGSANRDRRRRDDDRRHARRRHPRGTTRRRARGRGVGRGAHPASGGRMKC